MLATKTSPQRTSINGMRFYKTDMGTYPSVTTILGATRDKDKQESLDKWKREKCNSEVITANACDRGTYLHKRIENSLSGIDNTPYTPREKQLGVPFFWKSIMPQVAGVHESLFIEECVYDASCGFAGTADLIQRNGLGELELWDWKTSERPKSLEWIEDYCCQSAAYSMAASKCLGIGRIVRAKILIALPDRPAQPFLLDREKLVLYYKKFLKRLDKFSQLGVEYSVKPSKQAVACRKRK